jgi:ribose transport system permease protein
VTNQTTETDQATETGQATLSRPADTAQAAPERQLVSLAASLPRLLAPTALLLIVLIFSVLSPKFLSLDNLVGVLGQNALLLLAATAMTVIVRAGGIDLSIGVAIDLAAFTAAFLLFQGYVAWYAIVFAIATGAAVGVVNAFLIIVLNIRPFLATLSVWFIGAGLQLLLTGGGSPIYLPASRVPEEFAALGKGAVLGVAVPSLIAVLVLLLVWVLLERSRWGRVLTAAGEQPIATSIAGRLTRTSLAAAYVLAGGIAAIAGILLASRSDGFVANSGQLYVLDAIGAVFIGATLSRTGRPHLVGTLVGVLVFALLSNGMNLIGLSFYWQGLARGAVLLAILLLGVLLSAERFQRVGRARSAA